MDLSSIQNAQALVRQGGDIDVELIYQSLTKSKSLLEGYPAIGDDQELLLPCLRLLRDSLAINPESATAALLSSRGWMNQGNLAWLTSSIEALTARDGNANASSILTVTSQLFANLASNGHHVNDGARSIWSLTFPSLIYAFISHPSPKVSGPGSASLYKLCLANESYSKDLCSSPAGRGIWTVLLDRSLTEEEEANEWLPLLISCVALRQGLLRELVESLADSEGGGGRKSRHHPVILHLVASELQEMLGTVPSVHSESFLSTLYDLVYDSMTGCRTNDLEDESSSSDLSSYILEAALEALRGLLSREDQGLSLLGYDPAIWLIHSTRSSSSSQSLPSFQPSWIELLFSALAALGPPTKPQKNLPQAIDESSHEPSPEGSTAASQSATEGDHQSSPLSGLTSLLPHSQPYTCYRGDLLSLLANMVANRTEVAKQICSLPLLPSLSPPQPSSNPQPQPERSVGSVELLLSQAQLDEKSPVAREWALLAIRNLCLISQEARERIEGLEISSEGNDQVIETEDMKRMGMRLERDKVTGKMHLKQSPTNNN